VWRKEFASETPSMAHPLAVTAGAALVIAHASRVNLRRRHRLRQPMRHDIAA